MSNTWSDDLVTSTPVSVQPTLPPDYGTTLNHQPTPTPASGPAHDNRNQALTLVPTHESDTSMAAGRMTHLVSNFCGNHNDDIDITAVDIDMQSRRVEGANINVSVSEHGYQPLHKHTSYNECFDRSSDTITDRSAENKSLRTIDQVRTTSPRSPDMPHMHDRPSAFRPVEARNTPLHSRASTRYSGQPVTGQLESRVASRASITVDWLGSIMTKIVDEASERDRRRDQREIEERMRAQQRDDQLTERALQLMKTEIEQVKDVANHRTETEILCKEKELLERENEIQKLLAQKEIELQLVNVKQKQQFLLKQKEFAQIQAEKELQREKRAN